MTIDKDLPPPGDELVAARKDWIDAHLQLYLRDGTKGHLIDMRDAGGYDFSPTLLLKTIGRKTGKPHVLPLLYGLYGDEIIVIGSKGGHPKHPAWVLNMMAQTEVTFQIGEDRFVGPWRELQGADRAKVWEYMERLYPPFADYQKSTDRPIPVLGLTRRSRVDAL